MHLCGFQLVKRESLWGKRYRLIVCMPPNPQNQRRRDVGWKGAVLHESVSRCQGTLPSHSGIVNLKEVLSPHSPGARWHYKPPYFFNFGFCRSLLANWKRPNSSTSEPGWRKEDFNVIKKRKFISSPKMRCSPHWSSALVWKRRSKMRW